MPESTIEVLQDYPQIIKELIHCTVDLMVQYSKTYNNKIMEQSQQIHLSAEQQAQQKEYKRIKDAMKADIKEQSEQQTAARKGLKVITGDEQSRMQQTKYLNGVDLRHLFIAYAIFRLQGGRQKGIPETQYTFNPTAGTIIRRDGKAIRNDENAPRIELVTKILEKYDARIKQSKTVHLSS